MKPRRWLFQSIMTVVVVAGGAMLLNMRIDIYGIFRSARGRHLTVYGDERIAKYLLSEKYVPENFDAILIGSSVSGNWNTGRIDRLRVFNESLNGGNVVEEKSLADQALGSPGIQVAIVIIHPFLTSSHQFETVRLTARENWAALGSQSLFDAYKDKARIRFHRDIQHFDEFGTDDFADAPKKLNATLQKMMAPGTDFYIDEIALDTYKRLLAELHSRRVQIVYVIPPVSQSLLISKSGAFARYSTTMLSNKSVQDKVIDFTSDEFTDFRRNRENFSDGIHLRRQAALQVVAAINQRLNEWIGDGQICVSQGKGYSRASSR